MHLCCRLCLLQWESEYFLYKHRCYSSRCFGDVLRWVDDDSWQQCCCHVAVISLSSSDVQCAYLAVWQRGSAGGNVNDYVSVPNWGLLFKLVFSLDGACWGKAGCVRVLEGGSSKTNASVAGYSLCRDDYVIWHSAVDCWLLTGLKPETFRHNSRSQTHYYVVTRRLSVYPTAKLLWNARTP